MIPKRHHFLPRLHLQYFTGQSPRGHVWTYDSVNNQVRSSIPDETAVESNFYSVQKPDGTMDTRIEEFLSKVETAAAPVYQKLLKLELPNSDQERFDFATFLAFTYFRTPTMRRIAGQMYGQLLQVMGYAYATNPTAWKSLAREVEKETGKALDEGTEEKVRQGFIDPTPYVIHIAKEKTLEVIVKADDLAPTLYKMKWSILKANQGFFISSDNPLVRRIHYSTYSPIYGDGGFKNKTAEVTFPLSSKVMLLLSWRHDMPEFAELKREHVNTFNNVRASHAERFLYAHIKHKHILRLSAEFKNSRPDMILEGMGPKNLRP